MFLDHTLDLPKHTWIFGVCSELGPTTVTNCTEFNVLISTKSVTVDTTPGVFGPFEINGGGSVTNFWAEVGKMSVLGCVPLIFLVQTRSDFSKYCCWLLKSCMRRCWRCIVIGSGGVFRRFWWWIKGVGGFFFVSHSREKKIFLPLNSILGLVSYIYTFTTSRIQTMNEMLALYVHSC